MCLIVQNEDLECLSVYHKREELSKRKVTDVAVKESRKRYVCSKCYVM